MSEVVERLVTEWAVDPSAGIRGFDIAEAKALEFQKILNSVASSLPDINPALFLKGANQEFEKQIGNLRAMRHEAEVTAKVMAALDRANPAGPQLGPAAPPIVTRDKVRELQTLSAQLVKSGADAQQFAASMSKMNMSLLAGASGRIGDGGRSFDRGLANLRAQTTAVAGGFNLAQQGGSRLINTLGSLAVSTVGVSGKMATLASNLLVFGVGGTGVAALAVTALAAAKAWEVFSASQREAAEAAKETADALDRLAQQQKGPIIQAREQFDAQRVALEGVTRELAKVAELRQRASAGAVGGGIDKSLAAEIRLRGEQAELLKRVATESERLAVAQRALNEATFARGNEMLRDLSIEAATFGMSATEARKFAVVMDRDLTDAQRTAALSILNTIGAMERQNKALQDAVEADKAAKESRAQLAAAYNAFWDDIEAKANLGAAKIAATWAKLIADQKAAASENLTGGIDFGFGQAQGRTDTIQNPFDKMAEAAANARQLAQAFTEVQRDAVSAAVAVAGLGQSTSLVLTSALSMGAAFGSLQQAKQDLRDASTEAGKLAAEMAKVQATGDLFTSGLSFAGGVFGAIAGAGQESQSDRLMRENNQRLAELKVSMDTLSGTQAFEQSAAELTDIQRLIALPEVYNIKTLNAELAKSGMTLQEWGTKIERMTGLDILDDQGRIIAGSLEAAGKAFEILIEDAQKREAAEAERVAADLLEQASRDAADRLRETAAAAKAVRDAFIAQQVAFGEAERARTPGLLELRRQLTGTDNPQQQLSDALQPLRDTFGGGSLGDIVKGFSGFNLDDPAAREALSARVLEYVNKLLSGTSGIPPELIDTFVGAMGDITGILGGFADAANQATRSLSNVPQSINIAAYEFRAQAARARDVAPADPSRFLPNVDVTTGRSGGSRPIGDLQPSRPVQTQQFTGPIQILIQGGTNVSPEEAARRIKLALQRKSMATTGSPDDYGAI